MKRALIVVGIVWGVILVGLVASKEFTLRSGHTILLETVPVDPRDLFRGDYVILRYPLSTLDLTHLPTDRPGFSVGDHLYVVLSLQGHHPIPLRIESHPPHDHSFFLQGTVISQHDTRLTVEYGIESYFVPEGDGRMLEQARGKGLEVQAVVDRFGHAVIKQLLVNGQPLGRR